MLTACGVDYDPDLSVCLKVVNKIKANTPCVVHFYDICGALCPSRYSVRIRHHVEEKACRGMPYQDSPDENLSPVLGVAVSSRKRVRDGIQVAVGQDSEVDSNSPVVGRHFKRQKDFRAPQAPEPNEARSRTAQINEFVTHKLGDGHGGGPSANVSRPLRPGPYIAGLVPQQQPYLHSEQLLAHFQSVSASRGVHDVIRNKEDRRLLMVGLQCPCCRPFLDSLTSNSLFKKAQLEEYIAEMSALCQSWGASEREIRDVRSGRVRPDAPPGGWAGPWKEALWQTDGAARPASHMRPTSAAMPQQATKLASNAVARAPTAGRPPGIMSAAAGGGGAVARTVTAMAQNLVQASSRHRMLPGGYDPTVTYTPPRYWHNDDSICRLEDDEDDGR